MSEEQAMESLFCLLRGWALEAVWGLPPVFEGQDRAWRQRQKKITFVFDEELPTVLEKEFYELQENKRSRCVFTELLHKKKDEIEDEKKIGFENSDENFETNEIGR